MTDEELIARLRGWARDIQEGSKAIWAMDQDLKEAADRIEQLVATNEALVKERDQWVEHTKNAVWADSEELKLANARAERLEAAADYILDGMGIDAPDYEIDPDDDFLDAANSDWVRDVLTRLAAALRGEVQG